MVPVATKHGVNHRLANDAGTNLLGGSCPQLFAQNGSYLI